MMLCLVLFYSQQQQAQKHVMLKSGILRDRKLNPLYPQLKKEACFMFHSEQTLSKRLHWQRGWYQIQGYSRRLDNSTAVSRGGLDMKPIQRSLYMKNKKRVSP